MWFTPANINQAIVFRSGRLGTKNTIWNWNIFQLQVILMVITA